MEPKRLADGRIELVMSIDYGLTWPLSDIYWSSTVDWESKLTPELIRRIRKWCMFFTENADHELGMFSSEAKRKWFDLEAVAIANELDRQVGNEFKVILNLWF